MVKFSTTAAAASAVVLAGVASAQQINTPTALYTCQPYQLSWSGTAPFYVRVLEGGSTSNVLETLQSGVSTTSYTWNVNLAAGTSVTLGLTDASGTPAYTAQVTISDGGDTSCVGSSASGSVAAAGSTSSSAAGATSSAASAASSVTSAASSAGSSASSRASSALSDASASASSAAASASPSSGASALAVSGALGGVAALAAALMA
ncbi:hypothetical protein JCM10207_008670 [Rhodosporidiobolus poonsookiae]